MVDAAATGSTATTARVSKVAVVGRGRSRVTRREIGRLMVLGVVHY